MPLRASYLVVAVVSLLFIVWTLGADLSSPDLARVASLAAAFEPRSAASVPQTRATPPTTASLASAASKATLMDRLGAEQVVVVALFAPAALDCFDTGISCLGNSDCDSVCGSLPGSCFCSPLGFPTATCKYCP